MEFNEKLWELRKSKCLTQEELANDLYVSRTAISKWESGRGYPSIDSLKVISKYFSVSLDELLSNEELLIAAEADNKHNQQHTRDLVFGLLDCSMALFFVFPIFGQRTEMAIENISLLGMPQGYWYIIMPYYICVLGLIALGILMLALQNSTAPFWLHYKSKLSLILSSVGTLLFIMSQQPYAAQFTFLFLIIKALMLIKWV